MILGPPTCRWVHPRVWRPRRQSPGGSAFELFSLAAIAARSIGATAMAAAPAGPRLARAFSTAHGPLGVAADAAMPWDNSPPSMVTPALIRAQMGLARRPGARVASAAFVPVDLEPVQESNWCFNRPEGSTAHCRWSWRLRLHRAPSRKWRLWPGWRISSTCWFTSKANSTANGISTRVGLTPSRMPGLMPSRAEWPRASLKMEMPRLQRATQHRSALLGEAWSYLGCVGCMAPVAGDVDALQ